MRTFFILPFLAGPIPAALPAQHAPPIRPLGSLAAKSTEAFANVAGIRALSGGRVLINDIANRRVVLFDSTLAHFTVVADSTPATASAYSGRFAGLIAYRGDSTLFVDPASLSMLVIDPAGKVGRVMSVPKAEDATALVGGPLGGSTGFDASGRLVYRAFPRLRPRMSADGQMGPPDIPDTMAIVRIDLATRQLDTVAFIKTQRPNIQMSRGDDGRMSMTMTVNPLPVVDDWAVLSDGSIAFVRGRDYHVDWVNPDGTKTTAPKMPFEWQRLTDEDKVAFIDSVKAARERMGPGGGIQQFMMGGPPPAGGGARPGGSAAPPSGGQTVAIVQGAPPSAGGATGGNATRSTQITAPRINFVSPSELPDYKPPFFAGSVRADADGNLWIRTIPTKAIPGGPVYDVVNRQNGLVDRVQVPANRTIIGFAPGGVVYLANREGDKTYIERASVK
jgi:hypothetical protein